MKFLYFFLIYFVLSQNLLSQSNAEYSICLNIPEYKFDTSCKSHTKISLFNIDRFINNIDTSKLGLYLTKENFNNKKDETKNVDIYNLNNSFDTIKRVNIETGLPEYVVVGCYRDILANGIRFNETMYFDTFLTKKINYYIINQKNHLRDSTTIEVYLVNKVNFDKLKIKYIFDIEYDIEKSDIDSTFFKNYLTNPQFLFVPEKFHIDCIYLENFESHFNRILTEKKLPFNQMYGMSIKETYVSGISFKEKWYWDDNKNLQKKVDAFSPIFYRIYEDGTYDKYNPFWFYRK